MDTLLEMQVSYPNNKFKRLQAGLNAAGPKAYVHTLYEHAARQARVYGSKHRIGIEARRVVDQLRHEFGDVPISIPDLGCVGRHDDELDRQLSDEGAVAVFAAVCEATRRYLDNQKKKRPDLAPETEAFLRRLENVMHGTADAHPALTEG